MAYCNNIININPADFLGDSLFKLNTSWSNLDQGICGLSADIRDLRRYVRSLNAKQSPTISLTFIATNAEYSLIGDVNNNSLGSIKFGDDIPSTTQKFLTAAKVENLIDTEIFEPKNENALRWDGTKWINSPLTDEVGAEFLYQLKDCTKIATNVLSGQILLYNNALSSWVNVTERSTGRILSGDYGDITVNVTSLKWDINSGVVTDKELATNSVAASTIGNLQVVNNSFANSTITQSKFNSINFGEINTGVNIGQGQGRVCAETNQGGAIPIKSLRGALGCQISSNNDEITITAQTPPAPTSPTGSNLGTGARFLKEPITESGGTVTYGFKTIRAGADIFGTKSLNITESDTEITINRTAVIGITMLGVGEGGEALSDATIKARVALIFPPDRFPNNTICNVNIESPGVANYTSIPVRVPLTLKYEYENKSYSIPGKCIKGCSPTVNYTLMLLKWLDPEQGPENKTLQKVKISKKYPEGLKEVDDNTFSPEKDVVATHVISAANQPKLTATNRVLTLTKSGNSWV
jgi:hypothetical protein